MRVFMAMGAAALMSLAMGLPEEAASDANFEAAVLTELKEAVHAQLAEEVHDVEAALFDGSSTPAEQEAAATVHRRLTAEVEDLEAALFTRLAAEVQGSAEVVKQELEAAAAAGAASFVEVSGARQPKLLPLLLEHAEAFQITPPRARAADLHAHLRADELRAPRSQNLVMAEESPQERAARERASDPAFKQQEEMMERARARQEKKKERGFFDGPQKCESDFECERGEVCCDFQLGKFCFAGNFCFNGGAGARVKPPAIFGKEPKIAGWPEFRAGHGVLRAAAGGP